VTTLSVTNVGGTAETSVIKLSAGNVATVGTTPATIVAATGTEVYCVTVNPNGTATTTDKGQPWSAGNNGLKKGTSCP
jgi:hypothetical protein